MQACRLAAHDIACRRGDRVLFAKLSLDLAPGDAVLLTGPNGAGKSSLIRILAGLLRPMSGTLTREGSLGLLDERSALDPDLPLARALAFWGRMSSSPDPHAALNKVGLTPQAEVPVGYLSTGQRKRAAIARLLLQDTAIWLLDEPANGLDTASVGKIEQLIADHRASGGIAVVASHLPVALPGSATIALGEAA